MSVAWIRFFHFRIWNTNLAIWPPRTSRRNELQDILETTHVHRIVLHRYKFYFILETSSRVRHATVDRFWDDDHLAGQTPRSERLQLTVLLAAYWRRCIAYSYISINAEIASNTNTLLRSVGCMPTCRLSHIVIWSLNVSHWQYSSPSANALCHIIISAIIEIKLNYEVAVKLRLTRTL